MGCHIHQRNQPETRTPIVIFDEIGIDIDYGRLPVGPRDPESSDAIAVLDDRVRDRSLLFLSYPFSGKGAPRLPE